MRFADQIHNRAKGVNRDVRVLLPALDHHFGRAKFVAAVDEMNFDSQIRQIRRFFKSRIAAAHNRDLFPFVRMPVARRARRNSAALTKEFVFSGNVHQLRGSARRNDERARLELLPAFGANRVKLARLRADVNFGHELFQHFRSKVTRLKFHFGHQVRAGQTLHIFDGGVFFFAFQKRKRIEIDRSFDGAGEVFDV